MEYLSLGKIIDAFALDGTVKLMSTTDNAKKRYQKGNKVFLVNTKNHEQRELTVVSYRSSGEIDFVKFEEISTKEEALSFKGFEIQVIKDTNDLDEGYYFYSDLRGCSIVDQNGNILGTVKEVEEFPAQITLRVGRKGNADFFVPFIKDFIKNVDIKNKEIHINLVEGML